MTVRCRECKRWFQKREQLIEHRRECDGLLQYLQSDGVRERVWVEFVEPEIRAYRDRIDDLEQEIEVLRADLVDQIAITKNFRESGINR